MEADYGYGYDIESWYLAAVAQEKEEEEYRANQRRKKRQCIEQQEQEQSSSSSLDDQQLPPHEHVDQEEDDSEGSDCLEWEEDRAPAAAACSDVPKALLDAPQAQVDFKALWQAEMDAANRAEQQRRLEREELEEEAMRQMTGRAKGGGSGGGNKKKKGQKSRRAQMHADRRARSAAKAAVGFLMETRHPDAHLQTKRKTEKAAAKAQKKLSRSAPEAFVLSFLETIPSRVLVDGGRARAGGGGGSGGADGLRPLTHLPLRFTGLSDYFHSYKEHIVEEARAVTMEAVAEARMGRGLGPMQAVVLQLGALGEAAVSKKRKKAAAAAAAATAATCATDAAATPSLLQLAVSRAHLPSGRDWVAAKRCLQAGGVWLVTLREVVAAPAAAAAPASGQASKPGIHKKWVRPGAAEEGSSGSAAGAAAAPSVKMCVGVTALHMPKQADQSGAMLSLDLILAPRAPDVEVALRFAAASWQDWQDACCATDPSAPMLWPFHQRHACGGLRFSAKYEVTIQPLASVVQCLRMYAACHAMPAVHFMHPWIGAKRATRVTFDDDGLPFDPAAPPVVEALRGTASGSFAVAVAAADGERRRQLALRAASAAASNAELERLCSFDLSLTACQARAVLGFVAAPAPQLQLVQGPPGTGKTTTIVAALTCLAGAQAVQRDGGEPPNRIMVCAPSNKAVQVVLEAFLLDLERRGIRDQVRVALTGVQDKLPDGAAGRLLRAVYVDECAALYAQQLQALARDIHGLVAFHRADVRFERGMERATADLKELSAALAGAIPGLFKRKLGKYAFAAAQSLSGESYYTSPTLSESLGAADPERAAAYLRQAADSLTLDADDCGGGGGGAGGNWRQIQEVSLELLHGAQFIFCTLMVCGRSSVLGLPPPDVLIVDEAAQAPEAETIIALQLRPRKCLLVGDPQQLPSTVISQRAEAAGFGRSAIERLMLCGTECTLLEDQFRMHPSISQFPSAAYYGGRLVDAQRVLDRPCEPWHSLGLGPYTFIDVPEGREAFGVAGRSYRNTAETEVVVELLYRLQQKFSVDIVRCACVITFYTGQVNALRHELSLRGLPAVRIYSVDSFQGSEADIVLVSLVRANDSAAIGFVRDTRRVNVAITRARTTCLLVGNAATLGADRRNGVDGGGYGGGEGSVAALVADAKRRGLLVSSQDVMQRL